MAEVKRGKGGPGAILVLQKFLDRYGEVPVPLIRPGHLDRPGQRMGDGQCGGPPNPRPPLLRKHLALPGHRQGATCMPWCETGPGVTPPDSGGGVRGEQLRVGPVQAGAVQTPWASGLMI